MSRYAVSYVTRLMWWSIHWSRHITHWILSFYVHWLNLKLRWRHRGTKLTRWSKWIVCTFADDNKGVDVLHLYYKQILVNKW